MSEYPRMLYGAGGSHVIVDSRAEEDVRLANGFSRDASAEHRTPHQERGPSVSLHDNPALSTASTTIELMRETFEMPARGSKPKAAALTVDHIPEIVDAVFDRLKGMAQAATEGEAHRDALETVRGEFADGLATLKDDLLGSITALIAAPAPTTANGKKA